jgi:hypothetical protein
MRVEPLAKGLAWVALGLGLTHAGFSAYWGFGGHWLLRTVGEWAVTVVDTDRQRAGLILGGVALVKAAAAVIPGLVVYRRMPWPRVWRAVSWVGGIGLLLYGGANVVVSGAVLAGLIQVDGGYDRAAMVGHVALWDPLFALWGLALLGSLWLSRPPR